MGVLDGWKYRIGGSVSRAAGAVTDYQVPILVGESAGALGADVHCHGLCKTDFADLRFTNADGVTLLDYWIESVSGETPNQLATVWIEFDSIGTDATTFYMYYGNVAADAASNGDNTFPFFDHFDGTSLNADDWYHWLTKGNTTVSGGAVKIEISLAQLPGYEGWGCKHQFGVNYAFRGRISGADDSNQNDVCWFGIDERSTNGSYAGGGYEGAQVRGAAATGTRFWACYRDGNWSHVDRTDTLLSSAWKVLELRRNSTTDVRFVYDGALKQTITTNIPLGDCGIIMYTNTPSDRIWADWVLVRKYLVSEPTLGAFGALESVRRAIAAKEQHYRRIRDQVCNT